LYILVETILIVKITGLQGNYYSNKSTTSRNAIYNKDVEVAIFATFDLK